MHLGGSKINRMLINYSKENTNFCYRASLGESLFLDVLNNVDFIIGNSSSAFLEAPALKKTINKYRPTPRWSNCTKKYH